jgi:hypothetical protein
MGMIGLEMDGSSAERRLARFPIDVAISAKLDMVLKTQRRLPCVTSRPWSCRLAASMDTALAAAHRLQGLKAASNASYRHD